MPFANFKVPAGSLTAEQKAHIVHRATDLFVQVYGERARVNTLILVEEVSDGGWGIGDEVLTLAVLRARAAHSDPPTTSAPVSETGQARA
jgi:4-oxalocrotonate tautomerase